MSPAVSMRLMTELGPRGRTAGRYFGSSAEGDVPGGAPAGQDKAAEAETVGREGGRRGEARSAKPNRSGARGTGWRPVLLPLPRQKEPGRRAGPRRCRTR